jgi:two-component system LytT family response regulator
MRLRTLIVDDEPLARQRIRTLLEKEDDIELVGECSNGHEAVAAVREKKPHLIFLDVQMPELDGFGVLEALQAEGLPAVIFVTAYDRYAVRAFDLHAMDYLLKPFDRSRFRKALERVRAQARNNELASATQHVQALLKDVYSRHRPVDRLMIKSGSKVTFLRLDEIDYVQAAGNYVRIYVGAEMHLMRETMSQLEERLNGTSFVRIHRSTIVNTDRIRELQPTFHGDFAVTLQSGVEVTLSRGFRDKLEEHLGYSL